MIFIKRNAIRCKNCGDVIESRHTHDFQQCCCGHCYVDGGHSYVRVGGTMDDIEFLTEYEDVPSCHVKVYLRYGGIREFDIPLSELKDVAENYEDEWHYIEAIDEYGNLAYQSDGIEKIKQLTQ